MPSLIEAIDRLKDRSNRGLLSDAWVAFSQVQEAIGETSEADRLAVVGSVRRMQDTVGGLDLLAGKLDGLVWRVTLAPDGTPLVYDTMHPCGCYHMFFPTPATQPTAAPEYGIEWAFSPQTLPAVGLGDQVLLRIAAGTHYIDQLRVEAVADSTTRYAWRDYDTLRSLPAGANGRRSVFGPDGFIDGTDRPEAWLFWPHGHTTRRRHAPVGPPRDRVCGAPALRRCRPDGAAVCIRPAPLWPLSQAMARSANQR